MRVTSAAWKRCFDHRSSPGHLRPQGTLRKVRSTGRVTQKRRREIDRAVAPEMHQVGDDARSGIGPRTRGSSPGPADSLLQPGPLLEPDQGGGGAGLGETRATASAGAPQRRESNRYWTIAALERARGIGCRRRDFRDRSAPRTDYLGSGEVGTDAAAQWLPLLRRGGDGPDSSRFADRRSGVRCAVVEDVVGRDAEYGRRTGRARHSQWGGHDDRCGSVFDDDVHRWIARRRNDRVATAFRREQSDDARCGRCREHCWFGRSVRHGPCEPTRK